MTVLVVADERDRSANDIVRGLDARGVEAARINTGWFPQHLHLDAEFRAGRWAGELLHLPAARTVRLQDLRSVWYRSPTTFALPEGMSEAERAYARREGKLGLGGVLTALPVLAVNDPHHAARCTSRCSSPRLPRAGSRCRSPRSPTPRPRCAALPRTLALAGS